VFPRTGQAHSLDAHRGSGPDDRSNKENSQPETDTSTSRGSGTCSTAKVRSTSSIEDKKEVLCNLSSAYQLHFLLFFSRLKTIAVFPAPTEGPETFSLTTLVHFQVSGPCCCIWCWCFSVFTLRPSEWSVAILADLCLCFA
jgi:hypothetical protein